MNDPRGIEQIQQILSDSKNIQEAIDDLSKLSVKSVQLFTSDQSEYPTETLITTLRILQRTLDDGASPTSAKVQFLIERCIPDETEFDDAVRQLLIKVNTNQC